MKKINLRGLSSILSEKELKNVLGGSGVFNPGTCGWSPDGIIGSCNIRKDHVLELYYSFGGWWCCDSCSNTAYCGGN